MKPLSLSFENPESVESKFLEQMDAEDIGDVLEITSAKQILTELLKDRNAGQNPTALNPANQ